MGMLERGPGRLSLILEDHDVLQATILGQIDDSFPIGAENLGQMARWELLDPGVVLGRLDDHLVGADPVDAVVEALPRRLQIAFDPQRWKLVRDHPRPPSRTVRGAASGPQRPHLVGGPRFLAGAERARSRPALDRLRDEVRRSPGALSGDDDPPPDDGIAA